MLLLAVSKEGSFRVELARTIVCRTSFFPREVERGGGTVLRNSSGSDAGAFMLAYDLGAE